MKTSLIILILLFLNNGYSQDITGVYLAKHTSYKNSVTPSKNFSEFSKDIVVVEIENYRNTYGNITVFGKTDKNEIVLLKFRVFGNMNITDDSGYRVYDFNAKMVKQGVEFNEKIYSLSFAIGDEENYLILNYTEDSHQVWILGKSL